ncbi:hypothetical protein [Leptospira licerasiae]|uniref:Uncharacterized protein n=1 Tax=Leptospira licerasiae str. MMD4847 TaxID=1049971 RepID=A0ABN0H9Q7_9LEPT|nr:hypothetical protein [Leptospira licerasiae]EIE01409.1 hypothetical protein LEP1GSC185_3945 [Leptospira licerasiae serovar Varillal str. VAR 010]EJZ42284.1 hypothetical protein LEP1GSC178_0014 [Leptospira licerasiae str. MMD4847]
MKSYRIDFLKENSIREYVDNQIEQEASNREVAESNLNSRIQILETDLPNKINNTEKGIPGGIATLDLDGLLFESQRPNASTIGDLGLFVYQPGGVASGNIFTSFTALYSTVSGSLKKLPKTIFFDSSFLSNGERFLIPDGNYEFNLETIFRCDKGSLTKNNGIDLRSNQILFTELPSFEDCILDVIGRTTPLITKEIAFIFARIKNCQFVWDGSTSCSFISFSKDLSAPISLARIEISNLSNTYDSDFSLLEIFPGISVYIDCLNDTLIQGQFAKPGGGGVGGYLIFQPDASSFVEPSSVGLYGSNADIFRKSLRSPNFDTGLDNSATSGSAAGLPSLPAGYMRIKFQNSDLLIPVYNIDSP